MVSLVSPVTSVVNPADCRLSPRSSDPDRECLPPESALVLSERIFEQNVLMTEI